MYKGIEQKRAEIERLCAKRGVLKLSLFGSAVTDQFDPQSSDLDFLVEFKPVPPVQHAEHFFSLKEELQSLFGLPVDLFKPSPIRNPYLLKEIDENRVPLYDAA
ncbi:MAG: nucleotidyltransferase domain-containing protein [Desulfuromonadales bacterium]|nr:nucleotidyltransferase domain-containing protein [Desulfuromonadales bacterium]